MMPLLLTMIAGDEKTKASFEKTYSERHIVVTMDKDFRYMVFRMKLPYRGIILLRRAYWAPSDRI
jgi:hypothetical protein